MKIIKAIFAFKNIFSKNSVSKEQIIEKLTKYRIELSEINSITTSTEHKGFLNISTTNKESYKIKANLKDVINFSDCFYQISKFAIINIDNIVSIKNNSVTLNNDKRFKVSRCYYSSFKKILKNNFLI